MDGARARAGGEGDVRFIIYSVSCAPRGRDPAALSCGVFVFLIFPPTPEDVRNTRQIVIIIITRRRLSVVGIRPR